MTKKIVLIAGEPRTGKTTLAKKIAPYDSRIHLDAVCLAAVIKHPTILPPLIDPEEMMGLDIASDIQYKLGALINQIFRQDRFNVFIEEYISVYGARKEVLVAEGYALDFHQDLWMEIHRQLGREPILVRGGVPTKIDGGDGIFESPEFLRKQVHSPVFKHL